MSKGKLLRKVSLRIFQDEASGSWGIAHKNAIDRGFNAFWNGIGIFHDVFEHWFEENHPCFMGDAAFNRGGEMAAMGAAAYYFEELEVSNRMSYRNIRTPLEAFAEENASMISSVLGHGDYCQYFMENGLVSRVPRVDTKRLDREYNSAYTVAIDCYKSIMRQEVTVDGGEESLEQLEFLKSTITEQKVIDLHLWGYRMAKRMLPDNRSNQSLGYRMIDFLNDFTKESCEDLYNMGLNGLTFKIYGGKEQKRRVSIAPDFQYGLDPDEVRYLRDEYLYKLKEAENL